MPPTPSSLHLEPLLSTCRRRGARHLSLFGSAVRRPLDAVTDVDLHLIVPRVDRPLYEELRAAAEDTARRLAGPGRRPWSVELRHGPIKPYPADPPTLQLHLVMEDDTSLEHSSTILRAHRALSGRLLLGEPPAAPAAERLAPGALLEEARAELARWRTALASRRQVFRYWRFDPEPRLAEGWTAAGTAWELRCMVRGAAIASDLHYLAAVQWVPPGGEAHGELSRPLLSGLEGEMEAWRELPACCDGILERLTAILDRRLSHLARLQGAPG